MTNKFIKKQVIKHKDILKKDMNKTSEQLKYDLNDNINYTMDQKDIDQMNYDEQILAQIQQEVLKKDREKTPEQLKYGFNDYLNQNDMDHNDIDQINQDEQKQEDIQQEDENSYSYSNYSGNEEYYSEQSDIAKIKKGHKKALEYLSAIQDKIINGDSYDPTINRLKKEMDVVDTVISEAYSTLNFTFASRQMVRNTLDPQYPFKIIKGIEAMYKDSCEHNSSTYYNDSQIVNVVRYAHDLALEMNINQVEALITELYIEN